MTRTTETDPAHAEQLRRLVERTRGFIFDLDGTLYLGDHLLPGADQALERLRAAGKKVAFVSNKPIGTRQEYAEKLNRLGIPCALDEVINSSLVAARWLQKHHPGARCFPVAEPPVINDLTRPRAAHLRGPRADRRGGRQLRPHVRLPQAGDRLPGLPARRRT